MKRFGDSTRRLDRSSSKRLSGIPFILMAVLFFGAGRWYGAQAVASTLTRPADPVVLIGEDLPLGMLGISPGDVVAFRYDSDWQQLFELDRFRFSVGRWLGQVQ